MKLLIYTSSRPGSTVRALAYRTLALNNYRCVARNAVSRVTWYLEKRTYAHLVTTKYVQEGEKRRICAQKGAWKMV